MTFNPVEHSQYESSFATLRDRRAYVRDFRKASYQIGLTIVRSGLQRKFGDPGLELMPSIRKIRDPLKMIFLACELYTLQTLDEVQSLIGKLTWGLDTTE